MGVVSKAVDWAVKIAEDDSHGYDQTNRFGPDYDCSSLVISAYKHAGVPLTSTYTGNMRADFLAHGFKDVTRSINLATGAGLIAGDVLLHETKHTAMSIGNGKIVHAAGNEFGGATGGKTGDQTGREIYVGWYYNFPWEYVLRYEEDKETPHQSPTEPASPQGEAKEGEDYYIVKKGDSLWSIAERFLGSGTLYPLLQQLNGMTGTKVYPGTMILLHPEELEPETPHQSDADDNGTGGTPGAASPTEDANAEIPTGSYMIALKVLKRGDSGPTVKQAQRLLIATGYKMPKYGADGDYGEETVEAVKKFQKDNGIAVNGAVDEHTMLKLLGM